MIGDVLSAALPMLRAQAESRMTDVIRFARPGPLSTPDPDTGVVHPTTVTVYDGPCRVRARDQVGGNLDAGDVRLLSAAYVVSIPIGTTADIRRGDVGHVTTAGDAALTEATSALRVTSVELGSQTTARRIVCEAIQ